MNIVVTASHTPFISGGASNLYTSLVNALRAAGHRVELVRFPFRFEPEDSIHRLMQFCESVEFDRPNGQRVDRVISLQFPGYAVQHEYHVLWVMHQFRSVYELFEPESASPALKELRAAIIEFDNRVLPRARHVFTISPRVTERLATYNGIASEALAHPPMHAERFRCADSSAYVFCPSRLESLKRQDLLIEAARHLRSPTVVLIGGTGGQEQRYSSLVREYRLQDRVRLLGQLSDAEKIAFYAHAMCVFFAPFDEDYGYVTLEAMLAAKPVITCQDSGGPLEFVVDGETGFVVPPEPEQIAEAIDNLYESRDRAEALGRAGRARYDALALSWPATLERLLEV